MEKYVLVLIIILGITLTAASGNGGSSKVESSTEATSQWRWDFDKWGDAEGWTVSESLGVAVHGGALWLSIRSTDPDADPIAIHSQMHPQDRGMLSSPTGLDIPAAKVNKVRLRVFNLSPETDGWVFWRSAGAPDKDAGIVRFTMKPYHREWQEVVCHIDGAWGCDAVDQIRIQPTLLHRCGDIWIDWIAVTDGERRPEPPRPDVCSREVVPLVTLPNISQADFEDAFKVLDECLITNVPVHGFTYPVMAPGGAYGENWWQLDSSLNLAGSKWANQEFAEGVIRGFMAVQALNPDGRIDLWGGAPVRGTAADLSSLPRYFEAAYDVARRTGDRALRREIYASMRDYLDWWLSPVKRDSGTGLITAIAEETFGQGIAAPQTIAPMDLNVAVALGSRNVAELARRLGDKDDAQKYEAVAQELHRAINTYMWDDEKGYYCGCDVVKNERLPQVICTTFDAFQLGIAPTDRIERLIPKLLDPAMFNWGAVAVTSVAKTDPSYVEATGPYDGRAWYGDIWTMRNMPIVTGLQDIGRHDLAAELTWQTIKLFNGNWAEYLKVSDGSGQGVARYGWSASQYIQAVIEHLFGVDYDRMKSLLRVMPHIPQELAGETISLKKLILPTGTGARLNLTISPEEDGARKISITIDGEPGLGNMEVLLPVPAGHTTLRVVDVDTGKVLPVITEAEGTAGTAGVRIPIRQRLNLRFEGFSSPDTH